MGTGSKTCPKCDGRMEEGRVIAKDSNGANGLTRWVSGIPERSIWTGLKIKGKPTYDVATYRCGRCGFLEQYAPG